MRFLVHAASLLLTLAALGPAAATAQAYPSRTIKFITVATPSSTDSLSRVIAVRLAEKMGQPVITDNRPGAGGNIAVVAAARSQPDGYSFLISPNALTIAPWTMKNVGYDPIKDLTPVARLAVAQMALVSSTTMPVKTFAEFVALARAQPGKWDYATPGIGTPQHMVMEEIKKQMSFHMTHIPYPQSGKAVLDLVEGRIAGGVFALTQVVPFAQSGKLRILAVIDAKRSSIFPEAPPIQELGVKGVESPWIGMFAPAGTPPAIVGRMNKEVNAILESPEIRQQMLGQGILISTGSVEEFDRQVKSDYERWHQLAARIGIKPQ
ncbi:MAG TPA: tripartite tricarboxylate transporter substrate-binding protein [Ramlibacter sp.]|nr:tripartite tricarboxylate transporter substrate-binding protein [Ramlibacter sp.]